MGNSSWSNDHYQEKVTLRAATKTPTFAYMADVDSGKASGVHKTLDAHGVKIRESRDSNTHPMAVPVVIPFDVTGSMSSVPRTLQEKLPQLMGLLIRKGYLEHPAIMVGAVGDAYTDMYPIQIGQFESGIEIEENLTNLILEGNGGGQIKESYELMLYFLARHTAHDHWDKRGEKGYVFLTGDEAPYPNVNAAQVKKLIGDTLEADIPTETIIKELQERYHVYFIIPNQTSHYNDNNVRSAWKKLLQENVIFLDDPSGICECIAAQIGVIEGNVNHDEIINDLISFGTSARVASSVSKSLVLAGAGSGSGKKSMSKIPTSGSGSGLTKW